ncbi:16S rRNA (cytosine(1402)-N(4))-methyltransferase RsmH [Patescibacteria group bacterium]|nr:16S rRNA (cytosine(1402)-N(4))-methyltransferase RsmH [Patescibacteria group bacterium]
MHIPVLKDKVIEYLNPKPNQNFIDATLGNGGHTIAILKETAPKGKVLALDLDANALLRVKARAKEAGVKARLKTIEENFTNIAGAAQEEKFKPIHGILFDLGLSSDQLENSGRGFTFLKSEPLDMRYSKESPTTAEQIVNFWSRRDIEYILKEYGEEEFSQKIAQALIEARATKQITKTDHIVEIVLKATPKWYHKKKIHPATKTFQALRIAVNRELENLKMALPQSVEILEDQGTIVVISFHSLEDRMVKNFFKEHPSLIVLTKKPIVAQDDEIKRNPRSRAAKLRAARKVTPPKASLAKSGGLVS